jgi:hypothetical protein
LANCATIRLRHHIAEVLPEELPISTHLRSAAGVCLLFTALLIGSAGGAIAVADTDSSGSADQGETASTSSGGLSSAEGPASSVASSLRKTVRQSFKDVTSGLRSLGGPGQQPFTSPNRRQAASTGTTTSSDEITLPKEELKEIASDPITSVPSPDTTEPDVVVPGSDGVATVFDEVVAEKNPPVAAYTDPVGPAAEPAQPLSTVLKPVTNSAATATNVFLSVPAVTLSLPSSQTPAADVITLVTEMLTSVNDAAISFVHLPSDFASMLIPNATSPTVRVGGATSEAAPAAIAGPVAAQPPPPSASVPVWVAPMLGNNPEPTTVRAVETTFLSHEVSIPTTAPPATTVSDESGLLPFLEHTLGEVLAPLSLMALIAVVVPGVCGLLLISGVGVRIGYRQAKAGLALRASGIARFAGAGPLGVVGSGGLIALRRPRPVRVVRPQASPIARILGDTA